MTSRTPTMFLDLVLVLVVLVVGLALCSLTDKCPAFGDLSEPCLVWLEKEQCYFAVARHTREGEEFYQEHKHARRPPGAPVRWGK